jgi:hypothetical protein
MVFFSTWPVICCNVQEMPPSWCQECKILLEKAALAISANAGALAKLAEAVKTSSRVAAFEREVYHTSTARENAVTEYESHLSRHETRVMTAGSSSSE